MQANLPDGRNPGSSRRESGHRIKASPPCAATHLVVRKRNDEGSVSRMRPAMPDRSQPVSYKVRTAPRYVNWDVNKEQYRM
ncbi:hypothetical protein NDU88_002351 [Pleurodeles waltl]|uniref:Uncharacterized protein n=1 Tax=Pleurodeles waltl TaxID=8319 RepID=A0AAV7SA74_PLEWA|nr:hypothetical protein NDU88_002351 [Pleurodeles waltl]